MECLYPYGLIEELFPACHKWGYFVVFYYPAGRGKAKIALRGPFPDSWDCYF